MDSLTTTRIIAAVIFTVFIVALIISYIKKNREMMGRKIHIKDFANLSEWSYQRYSRFYGNLALQDNNYEQKMSIITDCILNKHETDIEKIAIESDCKYEECIMKISYLKNKRVIGDMYIDTKNGIINHCSEEDAKLLKKYQQFIYYNHYQISEMAIKMPNATSKNLKEIEDKICKDIKYLNDKHLLNGIIFNEVDRKIIYYSVEKHQKEKDYVTINCPNCGALNDVNRHSKTRCEYCKTIIEYKEGKKTNHCQAAYVDAKK